MTDALGTAGGPKEHFSELLNRPSFHGKRLLSITLNNTPYMNNGFPPPLNKVLATVKQLKAGKAWGPDGT